MFGSLFGGNNPWGQNGGHNNPTPQSAGSGGTPSSQWNDPNKKKFGGWPNHGGSGGSGGSGNNSQWPTSWPHYGSHHGGGGTTPPATTPPATTPPATTPPATTPSPAAGSWQANWEAYQQQQLGGLSGSKYDAEMAKDQRERDWYAQNKTARWFPYVEKYLAHRYRNPPKTPGGGGSGSTPPAGGGGGTPPPASSAVYTPGTFDRDPALGT